MYSLTHVLVHICLYIFFLLSIKGLQDESIYLFWFIMIYVVFFKQTILSYIYIYIRVKFAFLLPIS